MSKLILPTLRNFLIGAIALGVLLFPAAGTFAYWQAWLFILVFLTSVSAIGVYLSLQDPALLERRKQFGPAAEQSIAQKMIMSLTLLGFLGIFIVSSGIPLALGSFWGLLVLALITPILIWRIMDEEKLLEQELHGYAEYKQKVRKRLIPFVW